MIPSRRDRSTMDEPMIPGGFEKRPPRTAPRPPAVYASRRYRRPIRCLVMSIASGSSTSGKAAARRASAKSSGHERYMTDTLKPLYDTLHRYAGWLDRERQSVAVRNDVLGDRNRARDRRQSGNAAAHFGCGSQAAAERRSAEDAESGVRQNSPRARRIASLTSVGTRLLAATPSHCRPARLPAGRIAPRDWRRSNASPYALTTSTPPRCSVVHTPIRAEAVTWTWSYQHMKQTLNGFITSEAIVTGMPVTARAEGYVAPWVGAR